MRGRAKAGRVSFRRVTMDANASDDDDAFGMFGGYASRPRVQRSLSQVVTSGELLGQSLPSRSISVSSAPVNIPQQDERMRHKTADDHRPKNAGDRRRSLIVEVFEWGKNWCDLRRLSSMNFYPLTH